MDEAHEHTFEELDARRNLAGGSVGKDGELTGKKGKAVPLEPPLKRSIKGEPKGTPLPPPLTSTPLAFKTVNSVYPPSSPPASSTPVPQATILHPPVKAEQPPGTHISPPHPQVSPTTAAPPPTGVPPTAHTTSPPQALPSTTPTPAAPLSTIPASVRIPIVVGPVPASHTSNAPASPAKPIVLHENTLILNPEIFSHLTPQHVQDLEALAAQKALEILQSYIVRYYKEKLKAEIDKVVQWLDDSQQATKEEYESQQKELEAVANPIMMKFYGAGGEGGMPGGGMPGAAGGAPGGGAGGDDGPTVEEVD